jgi:predicted O-methyltransferase YrrM
MSIKTMRDTLDKLYPGNPGSQKADILYELARDAGKGCIVEVGSSDGYGTVALACGARDGNQQRVYAVDDYAERRGWHNEPYVPETLETWRANITAAGLADSVTLVRKSAAEAVEDWDEPVALLFWDPGVKIDTVLAEFFDWADLITDGGVLAVNDTMRGNLGVDNAIHELVASGAFTLEGVRYGIRLLRREQWQKPG